MENDKVIDYLLELGMMAILLHPVMKDMMKLVISEGKNQNREELDREGDKRTKSKAKLMAEYL